MTSVLKQRIQVIWSYHGFSCVNYALSEVKNPKRTVKIAGPVAIGAVTVLYILANVAYFAGATKEEIIGSGRLVAGLLFRNVYGPQAERALDVFVAISSLGGTLSAVCFPPCSLQKQKLNFNGRYFLKAVSIKRSARRAFYLTASSGRPIVLLMHP